MSGAELARAVVGALAEREPGLLLDVPAGPGPVNDAVRALGYRPVGLDLFPGPGFDGVQADACARLPFADGAFDAVVSMEGIEHFENPASFLRECARVLRPGGFLVLTTPNVLHLSARFSHLLSGQRALKRGFVNEDQTLRGRFGERIHHGHAFLIDAFRLRYLMALAGLRITGTRPGKRSSGSLLLAPLIPLMWLATRFTLASGRRTRAKEGLSTARPEVEAELRMLADSPDVLLSRNLIVTAERVVG